MNHKNESLSSLGIREMFSKVPDTYERINHLLTFGLDTLWRKRLAKEATASGGTRWIDMCTGTGETALSLSSFAPDDTTVYAVDFSYPMISKISTKQGGPNIHRILSDIRRLPFPSSSGDMISISFATRNINLNRNALVDSFRECHRVLKPGGHFFNLETSQPSNRIIRKLFHVYIKSTVPLVGKLISGSKHPYTYLSRTIPGFYSSDVLSEILLESGFNKIHVKKMFFGVAAIHHAFKK